MASTGLNVSNTFAEVHAACETYALTCATEHSILSPTPPIIRAFPPKIIVASRAHSSRTFEASACARESVNASRTPQHLQQTQQAHFAQTHDVAYFHRGLFMRHCDHLVPESRSVTCHTPQPAGLAQKPIECAAMMKKQNGIWFSAVRSAASRTRGSLATLASTLFDAPSQQSGNN